MLTIIRCYALAFDQWGRLSTSIRSGKSREDFFSDKFEADLASLLREKFADDEHEKEFTYLFSN